MTVRLSENEFLRKARLAHPDSPYDYSGTKYCGVATKLTIRCTQHGPFQTLPGNHMRGFGPCPSCSKLRNAAIPALTEDEFLVRAKAAHPGRGYTYLQLPHRLIENVRVVCPIHGEFTQRASNHLFGIGCAQCGRGIAKRKLLKQPDTFLVDARTVHGTRYDYSRVVYKGAFVYVEIACPEHGLFLQTPDSHLHGSGCNSCTSRHSEQQKSVEAFLGGFGVELLLNRRTLIPPLELDIFLPGHRFAIEYNGSYWHSFGPESGSDEQLRHLVKFQRCRDTSIKLLQIIDREWQHPVVGAIWKSRIAHLLGRPGRTIAARSTVFRAISKPQAREFLERNHLQGATPSARWCFGLFHAEELVGVITFAEHEKRFLNLTRLAFPLYTSVVGGASKLLKNALNHLPERDLVTFSDNRYSDGAVYARLGFTKEKDLPPSYQWLFRNALWNKRRLRHQHLPRVLGDLYDPEQTERENMFRAGARILYDAGYQRWKLKRL